MTEPFSDLAGPSSSREPETLTALVSRPNRVDRRATSSPEIEGHQKLSKKSVPEIIQEIEVESPEIIDPRKS